MTPHVTVIVLNWNGWQDTVACLKSLKKQTYFDMNLVVIDNASSDNSVSEIKASFPDVTLLQSGANLGFGGGCNVGIKYAMSRGDNFVWLINSDATAHPDALSALVRVATSDTTLASVGSAVYEAETREQLQFWGGGRVGLLSGRCKNLLVPENPDFISGASILLRCTALTEVGLFDESSFFMYWEDADLSFRLRKAGWGLAVAEDSIVWHKQSASLGKYNPTLERYFVQSGVRFLRRYSPIPFLPISIMLFRSLSKRLLMGQFGRIRAVMRGFLDA
jgi:GT2 family glycosyltransferase